jgi:alanyl-tRNA synthetase
MVRMSEAAEILNKYIAFYEARGHKRTPNAPLVPINDPTTLFVGSGMQALIPYLLGETHPQGKRLVNVQNCFRAQDIDEIGDNRHTTFFRMLGNWSLGDYFKKDQLRWIFTFLTDKNEGIGIDPQRLFVTVFAGYESIQKDAESIAIWKELFAEIGIQAEEGEPFDVAQGKRIFAYGVEKNWWSRSGVPEKMPAGEPGGPDSEIFYDFGEEKKIHENSPFKNEKCHVNCDCGRYIEIANSVFMQYKKTESGSFEELPQKNVDFGGGLERLLMASQNTQDVFQTTLLRPIIKAIEETSHVLYEEFASDMRIVTDHMIGACFMGCSGVTPSNKEQGYIMRRLIRRGLDHFYNLGGKDIVPVIEAVVDQYRETDPGLHVEYETIKLTILEEEQSYKKAREGAQRAIEKELKRLGVRVGDELKGVTEIPADLAFKSTASYGLGPTQLKSLGYTFDEQAFAEEMKKHQQVSRAGMDKKFRGGLADHEERTIMGHTATHLLHQALRDVLGTSVHQTGSNITTERVRFDFSYDKRLTDEEIEKVQNIVNEKIQENLPVHFELIPTDEAYKMGAIGLFMDTYGEKSKIYFIGDTSKSYNDAYSIEFCGGPHVDFTGVLKSFKILKQENLGKTQKRLYGVVEATK